MENGDILFTDFSSWIGDPISLSISPLMNTDGIRRRIGYRSPHMQRPSARFGV